MALSLLGLDNVQLQFGWRSDFKYSLTAVTIIPLAEPIQWPAVEPPGRRVLDPRSLSFWVRPRLTIPGPLGLQQLICNNLEWIDNNSHRINNLVPFTTDFEKDYVAKAFLSRIESLNCCSVAVVELEKAHGKGAPLPFINLQRIAPKEDPLGHLSSLQLKNCNVEQIVTQKQRQTVTQRKRESKPSFPSKHLPFPKGKPGPKLCFVCNKPGHLRRNCPSFKAKVQPM